MLDNRNRIESIKTRETNLSDCSSVERENEGDPSVFILAQIKLSGIDQLGFDVRLFAQPSPENVLCQISTAIESLVVIVIIVGGAIVFDVSSPIFIVYIVGGGTGMIASRVGETLVSTV